MQKWIKATRIQIHAASILPAILGGVIAYYETGVFHALLFILTVLGIAAIHSGANLINDYFDFKTGSDAANTEHISPITGGSRMLVEGELKPRQVLTAAIACFIVGGIVGLYLFIVTGPVVLWLTLFGIVTSIIYITPKFNLINIGMGEVIVGLDFGILIILGAYFVQTGSFSFSAFMVSLPIAIIIAAILLINEFQDAKSDGASGKMTTVVRIGKKKGTLVFAGMLAATVLLILLDIALGYIPLWGLITLIAWPLLFHSVKHARSHYEESQGLVDANMSVIMGQLILTLLLIISFLMPLSIFFFALVILVALFSIKAMKQVHLF
ncbi:MAG: prenyltransferase [Gloeobacteraceae cyanobacterium ES-bin-316]|nr:prenyltransferase [Ferruginibacter sp.]